MPTCRSFLVLFVSFTLQLLADGFAWGWDLIPPYLANYFQLSNGFVMILSSLLQGPSALCGPISSYFTNKMGARMNVMVFGLVCGVSFFFASFSRAFWHLLIISAITGFSLGFSTVPRMTVASFHFEEKWRHSATSFATVGGSLGASLSILIYAQLMTNFPWQIAFVYISCGLLQMVVCGALLGPTPKPSSDSDDEDIQSVPGHRWSKRIRTVALWFYMVHTGVWVFGDMGDTIFPLWLSSEGYPSMEIAIIMTVVSLAGILGGIVASFLMLLVKKQAILISNLSVLIMSACFFALSYCNGFWPFFFGKGIQGMIYGILIALVPPILLNLVDHSEFNQKMGLLLFIAGISVSSSPPFFGQEMGYCIFEREFGL